MGESVKQIFAKEENKSLPRSGGIFLHPRLILPEMPAVTADDAALGKIRHGAAVNLAQFGKAPLVRVFSGQTHLVAIARRVAGTLFHPKVVLI